MEWLGTWGYRIKITIDSGDIDDTLSNFPHLVYLSASSGHSSRDVSCVFDELGSDDNRKKIAITESNGTTQCYVEIERWDDASEKAWLWVKPSSIASGSDTDLYLYYDSAADDNTTYVGDTNSAAAEAVWDSNYRLVLHMGDDPDTSHVRDSTDYDNDGTKKDANEPIQIDGKIGKGQDFDGSNDFISLDAHIANFASLTTGTIECWVKNDGYPQGANIYVSAADKSDNYSDLYHFSIPGDFHYQSREASASLLYMNALVDPTDGVWYYYVMSVDGSGGKLYVDAIDVTHVSSGSTEFFDDINDLDCLRIGNRVDLDVNLYHCSGIIDEVRISSIKRTPAWITASYESGRDHLNDFGSEELIPVDYEKEINEALTITGTRQTTSAYKRPYIESLTVSSILASSASYITGILQGMDISDSVANITHYVRGFVQLVTIGSLVSTITNYYRVIVQGSTINDLCDTEEGEPSPITEFIKRIKLKFIISP